MSTLRWRGTKEGLKRALMELPGVLAGRESDTHGIHSLFWSLVGNGALQIIHDDFRAKLRGERGIDGIKWKALATATLMRRKHGGSDILYETGELLRSLQPGEGERPSGAEGQVFRVERDGVVIGSEVEYATYHQTGTSHMPARPIVPEGNPAPAWERELEAVLEDALVKVIERLCELGGSDS